MDFPELRYFLAVAEVENVNLAAKNISISPGSLSKAIAKLEGELEIRLFQRVGRGIELTERGKNLVSYARRLVDLEQEYRHDLMGSKEGINLIVVGPETLLNKFGPNIANKVGKLHKDFSVDFRNCEDHEISHEVLLGNAHLGLTTHNPEKGLDARPLNEAEFVTCAGLRHRILEKSRKEIHISEILKHGFVSPSKPILGKIKNSSSLDGWRDDKFPRKVQFRATNLNLIGELVSQGYALGYLPKYFAEKLEAKILNVVGCPYVCRQRVRVLCKRHKELSWLNGVFSTL